MIIQKLSPFGGESKTRVETRAFGDVCVFEGYLSRPEVDTDNDLIEASAWEGAKASETALLWQHKMDAPVGMWTDIQPRTDGLYGTAEINMSFELGKQAAALVQQRALTGLSVGFKSDRSKISEKEMTVGGTRKKVRVISKAQLIECSLVTHPALPSARVSKFSLSEPLSLEEFEEILLSADSLREFEAGLRDAGLSRKERAEFIAARKALLAKCGFKRDAEDRETDDADAERDAGEAKRAAEEAAAKAAAEEAERVRKAAEDAEAKKKADDAAALEIALKSLISNFAASIKA